MTHAQHECDKLFQMVITSRDPFCKRCGDKTAAGHHIMKRSNLSTRYVLENGIGLCQYDHAWAHGRPDAFKDWMIERMGQDAYFALQQLALTIVKNFDFTECRKQLRKLI